MKRTYLFTLEICGCPAVRLGPPPAAAEQRLPPQRALPAVTRTGLVQLRGVLVVVIRPLDGL